MHRMSGLDANFLYAENSRLFAHTLKIVELDVSGIEYTFERFKDTLRQLLPLMPPFCERPIEVPLRLDHPVWICDEPPDLDRHVQLHQLPHPGDASQFDNLIAEIAAVPLARERPLWELHVVEGLRNGRIGVVCKLHHSLADGVAASNLFDAVTTASADAPLPQALHPLVCERPPTKLELLSDAVVHRLKRLASLPRLVFETLEAIVRWRRERASLPAAPPLPFSAPKTVFNGRLSKRRRFVRTSLAMPAIKRVKDTFDCSVNDVVLALVAGAARRYLARRNAPLDVPLLAAMPISASKEHYLSGNRISNTFMCLATNIEDPVERLSSIHELSSVTKRVHKSLGTDLMARWSELSRRWALHWWWQRAARWISRAPINLVVSNVRGPGETRYVGGAAITDLYSVGPILERIGLNVTVWSYLDRLNVSILSCARNVPDPWEIADGMGSELAVLLAACDAQPSADVIALRPHG